MAPSRELPEQIYRLFNRGDLEGLLALSAPDVVLREDYLGPDAAVYEGHDGIREWYRVGTEALSAVQFQMGEIIATSDDAMVHHVTVTGRGAGSGASVSASLVHGFRWRDGQIVQLGSFVDADSARRATFPDG